MSREIEKLLYRLKDSSGLVRFVEADDVEDLFRFIAEEYSYAGKPTPSATLIGSGASVRVPVSSDKRFQRIVRETKELLSHKFVKFTLVRKRESECSSWEDVFYLRLDEDDGPCDSLATARYLLRKRIKKYLSTPEGWAANCAASQDYNWGDLMMALTSVPGLMWRVPKAAEVITGPIMPVDQDELLAPESVTGVYQAWYGEARQYYPCNVNFRDGDISFDASNCPHYELLTGGRVMLESGTFDTDPEECWQRLAFMEES